MKRIGTKLTGLPFREPYVIPYVAPYIAPQMTIKTEEVDCADEVDTRFPFGMREYEKGRRGSRQAVRIV